MRIQSFGNDGKEGGGSSGGGGPEMTMGGSMHLVEPRLDHFAGTRSLN